MDLCICMCTHVLMLRAGDSGQSTGCCKAAPWFCLHFRAGAGPWNAPAEGARQPPLPLLLTKTGGKKISIMAS